MKSENRRYFKLQMYSYSYEPGSHSKILTIRQEVRYTILDYNNNTEPALQWFVEQDSFIEVKNK